MPPEPANPKSKIQNPKFRDERWFYLGLGLVGLVLCFGLYWRVPGRGVTIPLPYALLYDWMPGFTALRVPVRFDALVNLALAVLGGYGLAAILRAWRRPAIWIWLPLLALMTLEYVQVRNLGNHRDMRPPPRPTDPWLAAHPGPVVELPMNDSAFDDVWDTYWATYYWQPLVNGAGSFLPPGTVAIAHTLATFPDPASIALLQGLEVRHVLIHLSMYPAPDRRALAARLAANPALRRVFGPGNDEIYEVRPDPWAARVARALPAGGYLWVDHGSAPDNPVLETVAYALEYNRLPDAHLPAPADHVTGDLTLGYRPLPALPYGQPADLVLAPARAPPGPERGVTAAPVYTNGLVVLYARPAGLVARYDLTAPNAPAAPRGLALEGPTHIALPGGLGGPHGPHADVLLAAFGPASLRAAGVTVPLMPGLTRVAGLPVQGGGVDLAAPGTGTGGSPLALAAEVYDGGAATSAPAPVPLTRTLVLDLAPSTCGLPAGTCTTSWRVVPQTPGLGPLTLTLDVYVKPFGTHPNGHLGSWSLPLPPGGDGRSYRLTLDPAAKTATATLNGAATPVYAWQGPPRAGDFHATLNLLAGSRLLAQAPVYDFTLDSGRLTAWTPAPGQVVLLPLGAP